MEKYALYVPKLVQKFEKFAPGHRACIGCGEALAVRVAFKAIGRNVIVANATGCMEIVASQMPNITWEVPWIHTLFENTAAVASGVESAYKVLRRKGGPAGRHEDSRYRRRWRHVGHRHPGAFRRHGART